MGVGEEERYACLSATSVVVLGAAHKGQGLRHVGESFRCACVWLQYAPKVLLLCFYAYALCVLWSNADARHSSGVHGECCCGGVPAHIANAHS
eukprot:scaffold328665_cov59-Tisochrysis_lutea.AAC.1